MGWTGLGMMGGWGVRCGKNEGKGLMRGYDDGV